MQSHYMLFKFRKVNKVNLKLTKQKKNKQTKKTVIRGYLFAKSSFWKNDSWNFFFTLNLKNILNSKMFRYQ